VPGDLVALVGAAPIGAGGGTNFLAIHEIRADGDVASGR
jgi:hypothetical protein